MQVPKRRSENRKVTPRDNLITETKYQQLKNKLERMLSSRPDQIKEVQRLAQEGDFSENVPYQMAKWKLRGLNNRILKVKDQLAYAEIIQKSDNKDVVQLGHEVTVEVNGNEKVYTILGSAETNPDTGVISRNSPLGAALLGEQVGSTVNVDLGTKVVEYKILNIK